MALQTHGDKPICFQVEENGEYYCIGSQVGKYLGVNNLYHIYPGIFKRWITKNEKERLVRLGISQAVSKSYILLRAREVEDIIEGNGAKYKTASIHSTKPRDALLPAGQMTRKRLHDDKVRTLSPHCNDRNTSASMKTAKQQEISMPMRSDEEIEVRRLGDNRTLGISIDGTKMSTNVAVIFNSFQDCLNTDQKLREEIGTIVEEIEQRAREILMVLQNIHNESTSEENTIVSEHCTNARTLFENVRKGYAKLAAVVPQIQYYRFHEHWRFVTQRLCFLASLTIYLEWKILVNKDTVAQILGVKSNQEEGFHLDFEDFLMGLLQLPSELCRFAVNSVTSGDYDRPIEISRFVNELNTGFQLLNLKNDSLRKRFDALKYDVKKIEEVVYDLSIQGLKPAATTAPVDSK